MVTIRGRLLFEEIERAGNFHGRKCHKLLQKMFTISVNERMVTAPSFIHATVGYHYRVYLLTAVYHSIYLQAALETWMIYW